MIGNSVTSAEASDKESTIVESVCRRAHRPPQRTKQYMRCNKYRVLIIKLYAHLIGRAVDHQFYADATKFYYVIQS